MEEQLKRQHKLGEVFQKQGGEEKGCPEDTRGERPQASVMGGGKLGTLETNRGLRRERDNQGCLSEEVRQKLGGAEEPAPHRAV